MSHVLWSIVLLCGLAGWIVSTICFIFKVFPEKGRFETRNAAGWGGAIAVSFVIWVVGMLNA